MCLPCDSVPHIWKGCKFSIHRSCLKSDSLSSGCTKMKALVTESSFFLQWDFPSERGSRYWSTLASCEERVMRCLLCITAKWQLWHLLSFIEEGLDATWCIMWRGWILEGAINHSLFGLVVPVVIVCSHINSFWMKKDLTHVSAACTNRGAEVCCAFLLCLHFNFLY